MRGAQAQFEVEGRPAWREETMTEAERREFEAWVEEIYWKMRAEEAMEEAA